MSEEKHIEFQDNNAANENYICIEIDIEKARKSWRKSVFSFQWMHPDGTIKSTEELAPDEQPKRRAAENAINKGEPLIKPVLGIGMQNNIEIGSGRAVFLTLADFGYKTIPVHIPKSNEKEFSAFLASPK